jgi:hypothetical protein
LIVDLKTPLGVALLRATTLTLSVGWTRSVASAVNCGGLASAALIALRGAAQPSTGPIQLVGV